MAKKRRGYEDLPMRRVLRGTFILLILIVIIIMGLATAAMLHVSDRTKELYDNPYKKNALVLDIKEKVAQVERDLYQGIATTDSSENEMIQKSIDQGAQSVKDDLAELKELASDRKEQDSITILDQCSELVAQSEPLLQEAVSGFVTNQNEEAYRVITEQCTPLFDEMTANLAKLEEIAKNDANEFVETAQRYGVSSAVFNVIMLIAAVIFSMWMAIKVTHIFAIPLEEVKTVMQEMERGNLNARLTYHSKNEIGVLAEAVRTTMGTLKQYVKEIEVTLKQIAGKDINVSIQREFIGDFKPIQDSLEEIVVFLNETIYAARQASVQVTQASGQVAEISQSLSENSSDQSSAVQQLAASVSQVSGNMDETAKSAKDMDEISKESVHKMEEGNKYMQNLLGAMNEIAEQSEKISGIIRTIDSIASQTNLLSLNASIEAARAGEAGRGFAVVADEIGSLAQECAEAAKNTTDLIVSSIEVTKKGSGLADETAKVLTEIVQSVEKTGQLVDTITDACGQQAMALENISSSVNIISESVEDISSASAESSSSSEELLNQAESLTKMLQEYKLAK